MVQPIQDPRIHDTFVDDELKTSYIDYAMSVIVGRALPDVRDGLKPVHRRILYAMFREGLLANKSYSKCAGVVGEVLKKYHPHGDTAVYDALVRMAQPWVMRYPLVDGQGNFGSMDGDNPAAYRYTESRLTSLAEALLEDMDKDTVDFQDNFDGKVREPLVLPSAFPNLLVNGSQGIAVGMATNIPPHNLGEVIDALVMLIDNPESQLEDIMKVLPGPDFPTAGIIQGRDGILDAYRTGRGKMTVRAKCHVEALKHGREAIIVDEVPYFTNKARLLEDIAELVREKRLTGISELRDESNRDGVRVVIELKKGEVSEVVLNNLYKLTGLEVTFGAILLALVDGKPRYLSLRRMLQLYIEHRVEVLVRRTRFELAQALRRLHLVHGLFVVQDNVDAVIKIIRAAQTPDEAREQLIAKFKVPVEMGREIDPSITAAMPMSREQAQAILDMRLARLTGLEKDKLLEERKELVAAIASFRTLLASPELVLKQIRVDLLDVKKSFGDKRRTEIVASAEDMTMEDLIADEAMVITVSHGGYIKRTSTSQYRKQKHGGKGTAAATMKDDDWVEHLFVASTHAYLMLFTDRGKAYWLKVYEIPEAQRVAKGRPLINVIEFEAGERVRAVIPVRQFSADNYLVMVTRQGQVVKTSLEAYSNPRKAGIKAINVGEGDALICVKMTNGTQDIVIGTKQGMAIRFHESNVRPMGRFTQGVRGITLEEGDEVIGMEACRAGATLMTVCANGYGKRSQLDDYRLITRGGKGVINIKATERNGEVVAIKDVVDDDELLLVTQSGQSIRFAVGSLRVISRNTQGVRLHNLDEDDKIVQVERMAKEADAEATEE